jgi:Leucine-rich repeat (LRR) protein
MASNKIEVIPDQISNLQNLTGLYIAQNQIT